MLEHVCVFACLCVKWRWAREQDNVSVPPQIPGRRTAGWTRVCAVPSLRRARGEHKQKAETGRDYFECN